MLRRLLPQPLAKRKALRTSRIVIVMLRIQAANIDRRHLGLQIAIVAQVKGRVPDATISAKEVERISASQATAVPSCGRELPEQELLIGVAG